VLDEHFLSGQCRPDKIETSLLGLSSCRAKRAVKDSSYFPVSLCFIKTEHDPEQPCLYENTS
jgi:hypothetical protein